MLKGLTLIELILVSAVISVILIPLLLTYNSTRTTQALRLSAEELADKIRVAHIYAREVRDEQAWGVRRVSAEKYAIVSGKQDNWQDQENYSLKTGVKFESDFFVWFEPGTGAANQEVIFELVASNQKRFQIEISKTGIVEARFLEE